MKKIVITSFCLLCVAQITEANANDLVCRPSSKNFCAAEGCTLETEGFQHAEVFYFHDDAKVLTACLWTNCYSGQAFVHLGPASSEKSVFGILQPDHSPEMYSPMLVTLTVDSDNHFTASWQHSGKGLTLDHGICNTPEQPSTR